MAAKNVVDFGPIGEKLVGMIGAARDAFNRHSRAGLDQFKNLQEAVAKEIDAALKNLEGQMAQAKAADQAQLTVWQDLLKGLHRDCPDAGRFVGASQQENERGRPVFRKGGVSNQRAL